MNNKSIIRKKFLRYFIAFSVTPIIIFFSVILVYISNNELKNTKENVVNDLGYLSEQLDSMMQDAYRIGKTVSEDEKIIQVLNKTFSSLKEQYSYDIKMSNELSNLLKYYNPKINIYVIGENKGLYKSGYYSFKEEDYREKEWYQTILHAEDVVWLNLYKNSYMVKTLNKYYIAMGIPIKNIHTQKIIGTVLVELQVDEFVEKILEERNGEFEYIINPNTSMIIENENVKLYEEDIIITLHDNKVETYGKEQRKPTYIHKTMNKIAYWNPDFIQNATIQDKEYYYAYSQLTANEWIIVSLLETKQLYRSVYTIIAITLSAMVILLLVTIYLSYSMSKIVTKPILMLKESVERVQEGNLEVKIEQIGTDEIGDLSIQFNKMVVNIKELVNKIYDEQNKIRNYEFMLLQAQINPHFLYNTLDSLLWLIRMNESEDAIKLTIALTNFFKTGLNNGKDVIFLQEEILNVESYLTIQQLRFKSKLNYNIYLQKGLENVLIPKMILQPLIENAIYHGIKVKPNGGYIDLKCYREKENIVITIMDDGMGITSQRLKALEDAFDNEDIYNRDNYGLINVNERLNLYYKDKCSMKITSTLDVGTTISIVIMEEDNEL